MFEILLSVLGFGQAQGHRAEERIAAAASLLSNVEKTNLEAGVRLIYEIDRLGRLAEKSSVPIDAALEPLFSMQQQNEQLKALVDTNRDLLKRMGANTTVVAELERWAGTCQVILTQIDLTVRQIEDAIQRS